MLGFFPSGVIAARVEDRTRAGIRRTYVAGNVEAGRDSIMEFLRENREHDIAYARVRPREKKQRATWACPYGNSSSRTRAGARKG